MIISQTTNVGSRVETIYSEGNLGCYVIVASDGRFFTIYDDCDRPVGSLIRPLVKDTWGAWEAFDIDGALVGTGIGPRSAFSHWLRSYRGQYESQLIGDTMAANEMAVWNA